MITTLCYLEKENKYLMLHRTKKENDINKNKWLGVGGKLEKGETPEQCLIREVKEETGLDLIDYVHRGIVIFNYNEDEPLDMYLYTSKNFSGEIQECSEGDLKWIDKSEIYNLNLWEGDKIFLDLLNRENKNKQLGIYFHTPYCDKICSFCNMNRKQLDNDLEEYTKYICDEIKKYGEDVLKQIAKEVEINEINDEFRKFLDDMVETMYETDGVGLAAPQIGVSKRIFVCDDGNGVVRKVINPIIVPLTEETQEFEEGCLSVPGIYKKVERPKRVLIKS